MNRSELLQTYQLIYVSAATKPLAPAQLRELLVVARKNNHSVNVSGMLVYHDQCFLQVLEGPKIAVEAIFDRVATDPRHQQVKVLLRQGIEAKEFDEWSMAYIDGKEDGGRLIGFVDYMKQLASQTQGSSRAHKVLRRFQEGNWREKVADSLTGKGNVA